MGDRERNLEIDRTIAEIRKHFQHTNNTCCAATLRILINDLKEKKVSVQEYDYRAPEIPL